MAIRSNTRPARRTSRTRRPSPAAQSEQLELEPRIKLWVEKDGHLVLSDYRVRILELVRETGSLAQAAERLGLSYRRAWGKVREIEQNLGLSLVESEVGGAGGGGSSLTDDGERLVALYERFRRRMEGELGKEFRQLFKE